jgi:hypothetical protein
MEIFFKVILAPFANFDERTLMIEKYFFMKGNPNTNYILHFRGLDLQAVKGAQA